MAQPAHAARPLTTDDADVLDASDCEWESFAARVRNDFPGAGSAWQTQLTCGVGLAAQLAASFGSAGDGGQRRQFASLGGKWSLLGGGADAGPDALRAAVGFGVNLLRLKDSGYEVQDQELNLVVSRSFAATWTGHAHVGWIHSRPGHASRTTWNLALENRLGNDVEAMGEVFGDDCRAVWLGVGLRWAPASGSSLNAAFSVQTAGSPARVTSIGYKLSF